MDATNLKVWLPFDESTTADKCGNTWTTYGTPVIDNGALKLNGSSYLQMDGSITLGGKDFTINGYFNISSSSGNWCRGFCFYNTTNSDANSIQLQRKERLTTNNCRVCCNGSFSDFFTVSLNAWHNIEVDYIHDTNTVLCFVDGVLTASFVKEIVPTVYQNVCLGCSNFPVDAKLTGWINKFIVFDGVALHTENFTPPTAADYEDLAFQLDGGTVFTVDVERKLSNRVEFTADVERKLKNKWRYVNLGTADTLITSGTTLTDLPDVKSITGTAFYQTTRAKCFDLPATDEIWIKFDVYFDGSNRWRAYNDGTAGTCGICSYANGSMTFWSNDSDRGNSTGVCETNQLQTVLLHMVSGSSAGIIEAWVDGTKIYTYTGDVNHGEDFADIYLQSDGSGTFFSNVIISNYEIGLGDGYQSFLADVERKVNNIIPFEFTADVSRLVINNEKLSSALKVWLPFDKSVTEDKCLNEWKVYGSPSIGATNAASGKALYLDGASYLQLENKITLGGKDFSIDGWVYMDSTTPAQACFVLLEKELGYPLLNIGKISSYPKRLGIGVNPTSDISISRGESSYRLAITKVEVANTCVHFELDYQFNEQLLKVYINGVLSSTFTNVAQFERNNFTLTIGYFYRTWGTDADRDYYFKGYLDEFRIFDGLALHTADFIPPTLEEYAAITSQPKEKTFFFDVERVITGNVHLEFTADVQRKITRPVIFSADVERRIIAPFEFVADVAICDTFPFEFTADINRAIKGKVKLFAVDNTEYFPCGGISSSGDSAEKLSPVVIPSQETIPSAVDNSIGLQSIEISLGEQQLTDSVNFVGVVPFDIMFPVQGQYLDYVFDMRVERVHQKGILYACDCCVDADQLLYTQIAYTVAPSTDWQSPGDSSSETTNSKIESVSAKYHASSIAQTIGKTPVIQFDDFQSTVLMENAGGVTYADLIRDVFGWSARVPTQMINVFIRGDKIYFVQRGHEAHLIDLTNSKHTIPTITHELVRMTWGSTPWSKTETREVTKFKQDSFKSTTDDSTSSDGTGDSSGSGTGDNPSGGGTGDSPGSGTGDNPDSPDDEEEEVKLNSGVLVTFDYFEGYPESGYVYYSYDERGLLIGTESRVYNAETHKTTNTIINQSYDYDGTLIYSDTYVRTSGREKSDKSSSQTTVRKSYLALPNGEKFLSSESTVTRENGKIVSSKTTFHGATRAGQGRTTVIEDGEFNGSDTGQNTGDDRVTPYRRGKANELAETVLKKALKQGKLDISGIGTGSDGTGGGTGGSSGDGTPLTPEEIMAKFNADHEANYYTETQSRTLNGLSLYDSSFPIHNVNKLVELTAAIKWLNRRTKETVTFTLYECPHLIDFNDRIIFNGAEYFLVSNIATTNARIFNEQRISLVRWY